MRKRALLLLIFTILALAFTSCGSKIQEAIHDIAADENRHSQTDDKKEPEDIKNLPDDEKGTIDGIRSYERTGVVIDTVVDVFREPDIKAERVTQALFNQPVIILEKQGVWTKVKVVDGYTGWIKSKYMDRDCSSISVEDYKFRIVVTSKSKRVLSQPQGGLTVKEAVMGTEFYSNKKIEGFYQIALPGRIAGWISEVGTIQVPIDEHIPKTSAEDFVTTVLKLKGTSYLWGGVSSWGIDCSGLTYITARINGVDLPRDADEQFDVGSKISKKLIRRGDLVFFSSKTDLGDISHVGIALGDGTFIHASSARGYVTISPLDETYYEERLVGVKRLF